ncbi:MAG TPA: ABC transporter ATP-binding protein [Blastocatellia bacterium]|jgi:ABC-type polysaccharide/polyol phosphate transport system ATPase subunit
MIDLSFEHVSKMYRIRQETAPGDSLSAASRYIDKLKRRLEQFWALRDVSFEIQSGEALGIIGPNGAGKSTVLKLLSKITAPTSGEIVIRGKLSALIEVGSGFHPELTGRENVYLSGSILGMRRREIANKLDSIVEFAEVHQFIDTPVKRYSSGMYVRLGFSIAAHLQPDILLLDEVLAVGDAAFQAKCFKRISELKKNGTTIVFISHDLNAIDFLCDRALLLDHGGIAAEGRPRDVIARYERSVHAAMMPPDARMDDSSGAVKIIGLTFCDYAGRQTYHALTGSPLIARVEFTASATVEDAVFEIFFYSQDGKLHCQYSTSLGGQKVVLMPGESAVEFFCPELCLQPGFYYADAVVKRNGGAEEIDWQYRCAALQVDRGKNVVGSFYAPHQWRIVRDYQGAESAPPHMFERAAEFGGGERVDS